MIEFFRVDLSTIVSNIPESEFSETEIQELAESILECGLLKPLVVQEVGIDENRLVDGHLSYYAACRAKEIQPKVAELVNAMVVTADADVEDVLHQLELLK